MKNKIVVKMPIRINFGGAWSDTPPFCIEEGGCVLNASATIAGKYPIVVILQEIKENKIILQKEEKKIEFKHLARLKEEVVEEDFLLAKIALWVANLKKLGFYLTIDTKNVPKGSGLGTSSILALAILKAIYLWEERKINRDEILNQVMEVERLIGTGGGWQDQAGAFEKGIKFITTKPGTWQEIKIEEIKIDKMAKAELQERLAMVYTGETRCSKDIVQEIMENYQKDQNTKNTIMTLKEIAVKMKQALEKNHMDEFAKLLSLNDRFANTLSPNIVNETMKNILETVEDMLEGKMVCGAGNGGFLEILLKKGVTKQELNQRLENRFPNTEIRVWEVELE